MSERHPIVELEINCLTKKGNGLGEVKKSDGTLQEVEVPFTYPGDKVKARILRKRRGLKEAILEEMILSSPKRIVPRCVHFASCGGCRWQHVPYEGQLELKEQWVRRYLYPYLEADVKFYPIIPCHDPWYYRNKMEFSFSSDAAKNHYLGLVMSGQKGKVLNLTECHLVNPWHIEALKVVKKWWCDSALEAYHPWKNTGSLRTLTLREGLRTGDRMAILTVSGNADYALTRAQLNAFVQGLESSVIPPSVESHLSVFLRIQQVVKGQPTNFYEMLLHGPEHIREMLNIQLLENRNPISLTFKISPQAFFQPNTLQAETLYSKALQMAQFSSQDIVYDLYCGTGTLGICAAHFVKRVIGIELSPEAVLDARANALENRVENIEIIKGDVGKILERLKEGDELPKPDVVMVDPPRAGLDPKALDHLIALNPRQIVYISCNPATQAENLSKMIQMGYRLVSVQPLDQFPQTIHIENIVVLKKN